MSDHMSGPRAIADLTCDICDIYAFPSPWHAGHLVLVMDLFPFAGPSALFSDAVLCRFRLRPVSIAATGSAAAFGVSNTECVFESRFAAPVPSRAGTVLQEGGCTSPTGGSVSVVLNDEKGGQSRNLRAFAGLRSDPFIFDNAIVTTFQTGRLTFENVGVSMFYGSNILSLVLEIDCATQLGDGPLLAVVGETLAASTRPVRLERVGRPELKNITVGWKGFDAVNRDLEIRDVDNDEDAFALRKDYLGAYRARLNANLAFYDGLDGKMDCPLDKDGSSHSGLAASHSRSAARERLMTSRSQ